MRSFDRKFLSGSVKILAGIDEAGRGPLAGPVVAASVVFPPRIRIYGVTDSKKLTEEEREELFPEITSKAVCFGIGVVNHGMIDKINILNASLLAMRMAAERLTTQPQIIIIDGNKSFNYMCPTTPVIKGDSLSFSIAAASIIAKVTRDKIMKRLSRYYPEYLWEKNKGYPTQEHICAIREYGVTPLHRKTFLNNILNKDFQYSFELDREDEVIEQLYQEEGR